MTHFRFVRYGLASVLGLAGFGVLASCVSGADTSGGGSDLPGAGQQGNAATGNTNSSAGSAPVGTGGAPGAAGTAGSQGGSVAQGGSTPQGQGGVSAQGGTTAQSAGAGGKGAAGSAAGGAGGKGAAGATGAAGSTGAAGGPSGPQPLPPITGGSSGFATRYWDCCKPACNGQKLSCSSNSSNTDGGGSACTGGSAYMCYSFAPFQDSTNKYISYAYAASHRACGSCWELQFTGSAGCSEGSSCPGNASGLVYNTLYVQVINTGDIKDDQFDLLVPGGGVGQFNACSNEWGTSDLGAQYGGFLTGCNGSVSCTQTKCNTVFANKPDLLAGCNWFLGWYTAADNPQINFKQVSCPSQLTSKSGISG